MAEPRQRAAADILAVIAGVATVGVAVWAVPVFGDRTDRAGDFKWALYVLGGGLALFSVYLTTRRQDLARWVLRAAGLVTILTPFTSGPAEGSQIVLSLALGLTMLGSSFFFGDLARVSPPRRP